MKKINTITIHGFISRSKPCSVLGCGKDSKCKSYCFKHYQRFIKTGDPLRTPTGREHGKRSVCKINQCGDIVEGKKLCIRHYKQEKRHGHVLARTRYDKNEIVNHGHTCEIILYDRDNLVVTNTLIDTNCLELVKNYKWSASKKSGSFYVKTDLKIEGKRRVLYLSSLIIGRKLGYQVDHISGDTLDNRRVNLRFVTQRQNLMNKTRARGISMDKAHKKWNAYISLNGKRKNLGYFDREEDALSVRRAAEKNYFGEFAPKRS